MHVKTRRKELVEIICALGLSVSYDRVLRLSSDLANAVCERYEENVPLRKATMWGKLSCESRRLKSVSILCMQAKPSLRVHDGRVNQSTITDTISKEGESLEDINKIYTAGKTETEAGNVKASTVRETKTKD